MIHSNLSMLQERLDETLAKARKNDSDMSSEIGSESQDSQHEVCQMFPLIHVILPI